MWLHPLPLPQPPHRYHPHQAASAASSGLQRCRRVGCCLLNLSLLTSTQHLISVSVPLPVPTSCCCCCCSFFVGSYLKFTLSKLVFILLSIRTSSFWGFVRLRHHFELFRPMGLGSLVLGLRSLGLGFPVAWPIKPTNLRASDALALVLCSNIFLFSFCLPLCGLFSIFFPIV